MDVEKAGFLYYNITRNSHNWRVTQTTAVKCERYVPTVWAIQFCGTGLSILHFREDYYEEDQKHVRMQFLIRNNLGGFCCD